MIDYYFILVRHLSIFLHSENLNYLIIVYMNKSRLPRLLQLPWLWLLFMILDGVVCSLA